VDNSTLTNTECTPPPRSCQPGIRHSKSLRKWQQTLTSANLSSWQGVDACDGEAAWQGVTCRGGLVTGLNLTGLGLAGPLGTDLFGIETLEVGADWDKCS
jgi:hypothetical protein